MQILDITRSGIYKQTGSGKVYKNGAYLRHSQLSCDSFKNPYWLIHTFKQHIEKNLLRPLLIAESYQMPPNE